MQAKAQPLYVESLKHLIDEKITGPLLEER